MAAFLFALLAAFAAATGARDQMVVASLSARRGPQFGLLLIAVLTAVTSAALAGWAGGQVTSLLGPRARHLLLAMALALAALELFVLRPRRQAAEPTESLGALVAVLLAHQLTDAARLLVFALAAASPVWIFAALGGAAGCAAGMVLAWSAGARLLALPLARIRVGLGLVFALAALWLAT